MAKSQPASSRRGGVTKSTSNGRTGTNLLIKWTYEMRLGLHLIYETLNEKQSADKVFKVVFKEELEACGFVHGADIDKRLRAQYQDRRPKDWSVITEPPRSISEDRRRARLSERIVSAAQSLHLQLKDSTFTSRLLHTNQAGLKDHFRVTKPKAPAKPTVNTQSLAKRRTVNTPKISYLRGDGSSCMISPSTLAKTRLEIEMVSEDQARPRTIQFSGLLYRFWSIKTPRTHDNEKAFWSRIHFSAQPLPDPPGPTESHAVGIFHHLNRNEQDPSRYISTSNVLFWSIKNALKKLREGDNVAFSVIDRQKIPDDHVFYANAYYEAPSRQVLFNNGAQRYRGISEFLIWRTIPEDAVLYSITIADLCQKIRDDPDMAMVFRIEKCFRKRKNRRIEPNLEADLEADQLPLSANVVSAIAKFLRLLLAGCCPLQIRHVVSDIIHGWRIQVPYQPPRIWSAFSERFLIAITESGRRSLSVNEQENVKLAFLQGVRYGLAQPNRAHREYGKLQQEWTKRGLLSLNPIFQFELEQRAAVHQKLLAGVLAEDMQLQRHLNLVSAPKARAAAPGIMPVQRSRHFLPTNTIQQDRDAFLAEVDGDMNDDNAAVRDSDDDDDVAHDWRDNLVEQM